MNYWINHFIDWITKLLILITIILIRVWHWTKGSYGVRLSVPIIINNIPLLPLALLQMLQLNQHLVHQPDQRLAPVPLPMSQLVAPLFSPLLGMEQHVDGGVGGAIGKRFG